MGQSLNDAADGFKAVFEAIAPGKVRFYPEPEEKPSTEADVTAEVFFQSAVMANVNASLYDVDAIIELSTPANKPGWSGAVRRLREMTSPHGPKSVYTAIVGDPVLGIVGDNTLGGRVHSALPLDRYLRVEARKKFADGERWTQEIGFRVRLAR